MKEQATMELAGAKRDRPTLPEEYGVPKDDAGLHEWSWVDEKLRTARNYWVCTTRLDGRPHAAPVWATWHGDKLYFDGHPHTRWARNLAHNPAVTIHLESGDEVVILEGTAEDIPSMERPLAEEISTANQEKYSMGADVEELMRRGIFALRPQVVLAWSEFPKTMTRWRASG